MLTKLKMRRASDLGEFGHWKQQGHAESWICIKCSVVGVDLILRFGYPLDEGEDCSTNEIAKVDHGFT